MVDSDTMFELVLVVSAVAPWGGRLKMGGWIIGGNRLVERLDG